jgi:2,5-furandicarboxylate decarboxylase 1
MIALQSEARAWQALKRVGVDVVDTYVPPGPGVGSHLRVSIRRRTDSDARDAIAVLLADRRMTKHVFIMDDDVDIRSHDQIEWVMASRFKADKDIVVLSNKPFMPMDPSGDGKGNSAEAGFDLTWLSPGRTRLRRAFLKRRKSAALHGSRRCARRSKRGRCISLG